VAGTLESAAAVTGAALAPCADPRTPPSNPYSFVDVGGTLFFVADDGPHGRELWKSDGTKAGTVLVKDILPGAKGSRPASLISAAGALFFTADDGSHGRELWRSDGTKAGTVLVKDIDPGNAGYSYYRDGPSSLTGVGGTLFFTADDGTHGRELWKSDGTVAGTVLVKAIDPNDDDRYSRGGPYALTGVGGTLFFTANDGTHGRELWTSDGTAAGTVLVKDIRPDAYGSEPAYLAGVGETLFFTARNGVHGRELWKSDGTEGGTVQVKDIRPGARSSDPSRLTGVGGTLFFTADDGANGRELWKSDGTAAGTILVRAIDPGDSREYSGPSSLAGVGGTLFFTADDGSLGRELWKSDGTEAGTVLVKDIRPDAYDSDPWSLTDAAGTLFFSARDGIHGRELWKSDGTEAGTVLVKDIDPVIDDSYYDYGGPYPLAGIGGTLFFAAEDGIRGRELWKSDGTEAGTVLVKDINAGGRFTVATKGTANTTTGTMKVKVAVAGAGRLVVSPVNDSPVRRVVQDIPSAGATTVTLRPTKAGMRTLERFGRLRINARFTFTPCGGTGTSVNRQYTLRLR
jgi:ELWxxDGT repeat protein